MVKKCKRRERKKRMLIKLIKGFFLRESNGLLLVSQTGHDPYPEQRLDLYKALETSIRTSLKH